MAEKSESESIIDMFAQLGRELQLPNVEIEQIIDHHRKNLEAFEKSARAASTGASSILEKQRQILENTLREVSEMAESYRSAGSPQEIATRQSEFARRSFESTVKNASEMAELVKKSSDQSLDILRRRLRDSLQEMQGGFQKRA
ncbi:TIGR01841 family phasin [Aquibium sp. A9E412]|uniref:phasin family protein n=1 Tax=Aquibium sp. A9E412 TaxID=2976767 RepID=UPI0025B1ABBF|nr:TIGR01841 family phasin [Aquibium sp. A9E412]MDN2566762.1 TIGR01841 family phasin [Aquibium sp. A9E412]